VEAKLDKQQKFIALRAEGKSFDAIAKRVKVSKPTLLKWGKEFKGQVEELTRIYEEQFIAEERIKRINRAKTISDELDEAYSVLSKTDCKNMNKKDLISMIEKLELKLEKVTGFGKEISQGTKDEIIYDYIEKVKETIGPPSWNKENSEYVYPASVIDLF
jgi:transposase